MATIETKILRRELDDRHVAVWSPSNGMWTPIPVALTPTLVSRREWSLLETDAREVLSSFLKVMSWLQRSEQATLAERLFSGLSDFERKALQRPASEQWGHVTIRMDLYWHEGDIRIIEVNCTIPAMQAYSDQVLSSWKLAGGMIRGEHHTSGNMDQLLKSLLALYRMDGGNVSRPRIGILHRHGDSQLGELISLRAAWSAAGFETVLATPDEVYRSGELWMVGNTPCDILYRHIFAWRLADHAIAPYLLNNRTSHIYNPVSAHYESKAFLAILSQVSSNERLAESVGLTPTEMDAVNRRVPKTRLLGLKLPGESQNVELGNLDGLVIKRSVGYGGHHVIMGDTWSNDQTQAKLGEMTGATDFVGFEDFLRCAVSHDESLWIAQERMSGARRLTQVLTAHGVEEWDAWFDASIFVNTRTPSICNGGVSRVARSPVVNIGAGGGLAPFLVTD